MKADYEYFKNWYLDVLAHFYPAKFSLFVLQSDRFNENQKKTANELLDLILTNEFFDYIRVGLIEMCQARGMDKFLYNRLKNEMEKNEKSKSPTMIRLVGPGSIVKVKAKEDFNNLWEMFKDATLKTNAMEPFANKEGYIEVMAYWVDPCSKNFWSQVMEIREISFQRKREKFKLV